MADPECPLASPIVERALDPMASQDPPVPPAPQACHVPQTPQVLQLPILHM